MTYLDQPLSAFSAEVRRILRARLTLYHWNVSRAAKSFDLPASSLRQKIERYGLSAELTQNGQGPGRPRKDPK